MVRLRQRDLLRLLECLGEVYAHLDLHSFAPRALRVCRKAVASDDALGNEVNRRARTNGWVTDPVGADLSGPKEGQGICFRGHPVLNQLRRAGDGPPLPIPEFRTSPEYREAALCREVYRRPGVKPQLDRGLPSPSPRFSAGLAFDRGRRGVSSEERLRFKLLRPHLLQAYRNAELVAQLRGRTGQTALALEAAREGVIILNARGGLRFCSARAREYLVRHFGATALRRGRLPKRVSRWLRQQQPLPATRAHSLPPPPGPLVVAGGGRRLTIRVAAGSASGQQVVLLEERQAEWTAAALRQLGLTGREAEVLRWVAQGKTNPEIGTILGVSEGTVRKHTEHIFEKLGVETRTAAAARAFEVLNRDPD